MSFVFALALTARILAGPPPSVELTNTGPQPVTAWSFAVVSPNGQGGTHRETHTADAYLAEVTRNLPRAPQHLDWLQPGKSVRIPVDTAPPGATVEIVAVVFADRTAEGDPETLQTFFAHRRIERDQLRDVTETFDGVLSAQHGVAGLRALQARFASAPPDSVPHQTARDTVAAYLAQAERGPEVAESAEQQLRQYAAFVKKQYELAVTHAERRGI
jgi:hypothetical protein